MREVVNMKKGRKKIVVAVDESEESMHALSWCLKDLVPRNSNSTLFLLYVKPPPPPVYSLVDAAGLVFSGDVIANVENFGAQLVRSVMDRADAVYRNFHSDVNVERVIRSGEAKDVICNTVEKLQADTLVMGSHGYGFLKRALLGSVSDYCAKHAKCPVVIVKLS